MNKKKSFYNIKIIIYLLILILLLLIFNIKAEEKILILKEENNEYKNKMYLIYKKKWNNYSNSYNFQNNMIFNEDINQIKEILKNKINRTYMKFGKVNINEIEETIPGGRQYQRKKNRTEEINIGFQLDPGYILRAMITVASIMDSQNRNTQIRFHFIVVLGFSAENMLKIYSLRDKIRDDVEFNFYNGSRVEKDFYGMHPKGPGAVAKILLPHLLPKDIERIIIFDTGDLLVLRDLSEMYNWNLNNYLYFGAPDPRIGANATISKKPFEVYINIGHYLLNVKKIKSKKMYDKYLKYKNMYSNHIKKVYMNHIPDQDLLNDIAQKSIGYLPIKYGLFSPFVDDKDSDNPNIINQYEIFNMNEQKLNKTYSYIPKNSSQFFRQSYNPVVIHQWNGKWQNGSGLTIYRRICQYYIRYAGIWNELCEKYPGYCQK